MITALQLSELAWPISEIAREEDRVTRLNMATNLLMIIGRDIKEEMRLRHENHPNTA